MLFSVKPFQFKSAVLHSTCRVALCSSAGLAFILAWPYSMPAHACFQRRETGIVRFFSLFCILNLLPIAVFHCFWQIVVKTTLMQELKALPHRSLLKKQQKANSKVAKRNKLFIFFWQPPGFPAQALHVFKVVVLIKALSVLLLSGH